MVHQLNLVIHIAAGTIALVVGIIILIQRKGTRLHKNAGRYFVCLLTIVTATGFIGSLFFRSNPFLLMLTILAGYNTYSGYRIVKRKEDRSTWWDISVAFAAFFTGLTYLFQLMYTDSNWTPSIIYSTLSGIVVVTVYDMLKHLFFHSQLKSWWLYEHIYKIISAFGAVFSAFVGTILPQLKPFSQIGPSLICILLIVFFIIREVRRVKIKPARLSV